MFPLWDVKLGVYFERWSKIINVFFTFIKKVKKEAASHRYNRLPLLPSGPGGFGRSWSCRLSTKVRQKLSLAKLWTKIYFGLD